MVASRDTGLIPTLAPLLLGGVAGSLLYPNGPGIRSSIGPQQSTQTMLQTLGCPTHERT
jgi:hypothetical protein